MAVQSVEEVLSALNGGEESWEALLGEAESEWLEFKTSLGELKDDPRTKRELAKDVSALANSRGGIIIVGVATSFDGVRHREEAVKLKPLPQAFGDVQRIKDIIGEYTYPPVAVEADWHPTSDRESGLISIRVPRKSGSDPYILVAPPIGKSPDWAHYFAIFLRAGDRVRALSQGEIHRLLTVAPRPTREASTSRGAASHIRVHALRRAAEDMIRSEFERSAIWKPYLLLIAFPEFDYTVPWLAPESWDVNPVVYPPYLRDDGWNLAFIAQPTERLPKPLVGVRKHDDGVHHLSVASSGATLFAVSAREITLDAREGLINPVALAEYTYEFCRFFAGIVLQGQPGHCSYGISLGIDDAAGEFMLGRGESSDDYIRRSHAYQKLSEGWDEELEAVEPEPGAAAFRLLARFYFRFGMGGRQVPYVEDESVSERLLLEARPTD